MNQFDTDIKKYVARTRLTAKERTDLRDRVVSYMEYHPRAQREQGVRVAETESFVTQLRRSFITSDRFVTFNIGRFATVASLVILIIAPLVAERAVPGDVLYLIKTGVNETVQEKLAVSPYEKIQFETRLIERRIAEARTLASEGKLSEEVQTQIEETVKEHATAIRDGIDELRTQNADEAALATIEYTSSLEVQSAVLDADTTNEPIIDTILTIVNDARDESVVVTEETDLSYDSLIAKVETETTRAFEFGETIKKSATGDEVEDIDRRLSDIERLIEEAKSEEERGIPTSTEKLATTLGLIQKLIVFMTDINVRETVELEALVPVVLSGEERLAEVERAREVAQAILDEITTRLPEVTDPDFVEKIEYGRDSLADALLRVQVAINTSNVAIAEEAIIEARAFSEDLDLLIDGVLPPMREIEVDPVVDTSTSTIVSEITETVGTSTEATTTPDDVPNPAI